MSVLVNGAYGLGLLACSPVFAYRAVTQGKYRRGWRQRRGYVDRPGGSGRLIWIHAVSVGEINATRTLAERIKQRLPGHELVFSTTTDTGQQRAQSLYGPERIFYFPLDFSWMVRRALRRLKPAAIVLLELEVWYHLVHEAWRMGIPVTVVNGRLTERSCRRYRLGGPFVRSMFSKLAWVGAQDHAIAQRFVSLGARPECVAVAGTMKYDTALVADHVDGQEALAEAVGLRRDRPILVAGSTGPGEEPVVLEAFGRLKRQFDGAQLVVVPRKPERFDQVAATIQRHGYECVRRSLHPDGCPAARSDRAVVLGDTMGELRKFYALADAVFVGRSIAPLGGSDVLEIAGLGKPAVIGPSYYNFQAPVEALSAGEALIALPDRPGHFAQILSEALGRLLGDPAAAVRMGQAAREVVVANQGATERIVDGICAALEVAGGGETTPRAGVAATPDS